MFVAYLSVVAAGDVLHEALVVEEIVAVRGKWMSKRDAPEVPLRDPNPLIADDMSISKLDGTCWSYQSGGTSYKFCPFRYVIISLFLLFILNFCMLVEILLKLHRTIDQQF